MEVFPTCIRQSGIGFCTLISQAISIGGPYVIYLGQVDLKLPYAIMFMICLLGFVAATLLPETLYHNLPETLHEASTFASKDKFFSYLPAKKEAEKNKKQTGDKKKAKQSGLPEGDSLVDWNELMRDAFDGKSSSPPDGVSPQLVRDLLVNHYAAAKESNI